LCQREEREKLNGKGHDISELASCDERKNALYLIKRKKERREAEQSVALVEEHKRQTLKLSLRVLERTHTQTPKNKTKQQLCKCAQNQ
jgi:hypothetical protein